MRIFAPHLFSRYTIQFFDRGCHETKDFLTQICNSFGGQFPNGTGRDVGVQYKVGKYLSHTLRPLITNYSDFFSW